MFFTFAIALLLRTVTSQATTNQSALVIPSPTNSYNDTRQNPTDLVVVLLQTVVQYPVIALTQIAYSKVPADLTLANGLGQNIVQVTSTIPGNLTNQNIAFMSCDPMAYQAGDVDFQAVLQNTVNAQPLGIIFYSSVQPFCNISNATNPPFGFQNIYTMTDIMYATDVEQFLMKNNASTTGEIMTFNSYNNLENKISPGGLGSASTKVAMIILYSITGIITALFLAIIVTGAVRAHRHPERYGPRNIIGRPRQSRAKGIARAMLETLPIVKYGERESDVVKPNDVELGNIASSSTPPAVALGDDANIVASSSNEKSIDHQNGEHETDNAGPAPAAGESRNNDDVLGCSICTEDFERGQEVRVLPCDHKFHPACVDPWLLDVSGTCPLWLVFRFLSSLFIQFTDNDHSRVDLRRVKSQDGENDPTAESSDQNNDELPPPLDPDHALSNNARRRAAIRSLFDRRRLQGSTQDERIAAIRRFRASERQEQNASNASNPSEAEQTQEGQTRQDVTRWNRLRRSIHFGNHR